MTKAISRLTDGFKTDVTIGKHSLISDEPVSAGGTDLGPSPTELVMAALSACMTITAKIYANRKKWPLQGVELSVGFERIKAADYPAYEGDALQVSEFNIEARFDGDDLTDEQKQRILEIAGRCPVHRLLENPTFFTAKLVEDFVDEVIREEAVAGD
jgi:putative redox protein